MLKRNSIKNKYGRDLSPGLGIVVVVVDGYDDPWGGSIGIDEINEDINMLNALCVGAFNAYEHHGNFAIYVVYQAKNQLSIEQYIGKPIFRNPVCSGTKLGC